MSCRVVDDRAVSCQASLEAAQAAEEQCIAECEALRKKLHGEKELQGELQRQRAQATEALHELNHTLKQDSILRSRIFELEENAEKLKAANFSLLHMQDKLQAEIEESRTAKEVHPAALSFHSAKA